MAEFDANETPQVILNPVPGFDRFLEEMDLLEKLEGLPEDEGCVADLHQRVSSVDWKDLSEENFVRFKDASAKDELLCAALDVWLDSRRTRAEAKERREKWEAEVHGRLQFFESLSAQMSNAQGLERTVVSPLPRQAGSQALVKLTAHSGILFTYPYDRKDKGKIGPDPLRADFGEWALTLKKPVVAKRALGVQETITLMGVSSLLEKKADAKAEKVVYFFASKRPHRVQLAFEYLPWGGAQARYFEFTHADWKMGFRSHDDPLQMFHKLYFENLKETVSDLTVSSLTVEGRLDQFKLDQAIFTLFLATGYEFTLIETQTMSGSGEILSIQLPTYGHRAFVQAPVGGDEWIEVERLKKLFEQVQRLPDFQAVVKSKERRLSNHHFNAVVHGMMNSWKQPIQKSIVDLYQVIDTLANCHEKIPRSKTPNDAFRQMKQRQDQFLESLSKNPTAIPVLSDQNGIPLDSNAIIEQLRLAVKFQSNNVGVADKIRSLMQECQISYDSQDRNQKRAMDLRNEISHSLAAAKVKEVDDEEGAYSLAELRGVRDTLWVWSVAILEKMLE